MVNVIPCSPAVVSLKLFLSLLLIFLSAPALAQKWGYATLIARHNINNIQLIDTNNVVVKHWGNLPGETGYSAYLTEGGDLWRTAIVPDNTFQAGYAHGRIQKIGWDGTILFDYTISDANQCLHHDICPMPNGNILVLAYVRKTPEELEAAGMLYPPNSDRWSEKIMEIKPTGLNTATIVWEWDLWDHLIQDSDKTKDNYQAHLIDYPGRFNINSLAQLKGVALSNIDYNIELDQIVVTTGNFITASELWVIDHSTSTAEAATNSGGKSGMGGDFIYRWGSPEGYGAPMPDDFPPNYYHSIRGAYWIPKGCPREGWLSAITRSHTGPTRISAFKAPWDGNQYTRAPDQAYMPLFPDFTVQFFAPYFVAGNSQQLPNGNILVCEGSNGKVYEIGPNGNKLWQYVANFAEVPKAFRYTRCHIEGPKIAVANPEPSICVGEPIQLEITPSATNVSGFVYEWSPTDGLSDPTVQNPLVSGLFDTTIYTVIITTSSGCTASATIPINVVPPPAADAGEDVTILIGEGTTLTATGGDTYFWSNGRATQEITVSPLTTTTYTVTVTGENGCTATAEVTVYVITTPPLGGSVSATDSTICQGFSLQLFATATEGTGTYTFTWSSEPAGFVSNLPDPYVKPEENTVYTLEIFDGQSTVVLSIGIQVHPYSQQPEATLVGDALISSSPVNNQWFFNGFPINGATEQVFVPVLEGIYQVQFIDENGCPSPLSEPYVYPLLSTGLLLEDEAWSVMPNPASSELRILGDFVEEAFSVELWGNTGVLLLRERNSRRISVADLPAGVYWIRLNTSKGIGVCKVVVAH